MRKRKRVRASPEDIADAIDRGDDRAHTLITRTDGESLHSTRLWVDSEGRTLVHLAAARGCTRCLVALLDRGADPNAMSMTHGRPLHAAVRASVNHVIPMLVQRRASLDGPDAQGETPLHTACSAGNIGGVRVLVQNGATIDARNHRQETPLHRALAKRHESVAVYLIEHGAHVASANGVGETPLHVAVAAGLFSAMSMLIERGACVHAVTSTRRWTPMHYAARYGRSAAISALVRAGGHVDARDIGNRTPLILESHYRKTMVTALLLQLGANARACDHRERTSLHYAALHGDATAMNMLLKYGADINAVDNVGDTPLHFAFLVAPTCPHAHATVSFMLFAGATPDAVNANGQTALDLSFSSTNALATAYLAAFSITRPEKALPEDVARAANFHNDFALMTLDEHMLRTHEHVFAAHVKAHDPCAQTAVLYARRALFEMHLEHGLARFAGSIRAYERVAVEAVVDTKENIRNAARTFNVSAHQCLVGLYASRLAELRALRDEARIMRSATDRAVSDMRQRLIGVRAHVARAGPTESLEDWDLDRHAGVQ